MCSKPFSDLNGRIYQPKKENGLGVKFDKNNYIMDNNDIFKKHLVVVLKDGEIVEQYNSVKDFYKVYQMKTYNCIAERIRLCRDGWMPDGKVARYYADRHKAGTPLHKAMIREPKEKAFDERKMMKKDLADTEAKMQEVYDACDRGEITYAERAERLGWLQNHAAVLRQRLKIKRED